MVHSTLNIHPETYQKLLKKKLAIQHQRDKLITWDEFLKEFVLGEKQ